MFWKKKTILHLNNGSSWKMKWELVKNQYMYKASVFDYNKILY